VDPLVAAKLGRSEVYAGSGVDSAGRLQTGDLLPPNLTADRLFVRDKLRVLMSERMWRFVIERVDVYAPCSILHGVCLLDGPGETR